MTNYEETSENQTKNNEHVQHDSRIEINLETHWTIGADAEENWTGEHFWYTVACMLYALRVYI